MCEVMSHCIAYMWLLAFCIYKMSMCIFWEVSIVIFCPLSIKYVCYWGLVVSIFSILIDFHFCRFFLGLVQCHPFLNHSNIICQVFNVLNPVNFVICYEYLINSSKCGYAVVSIFFCWEKNLQGLTFLGSTMILYYIKSGVNIT